MINRSMPNCTVIPVLAYADVVASSHWLCDVFGFSVRWRAGNHRVQLSAGDGCVVVTEGDPASAGHSIMVRVDNVNAHHAHARQQGAHILSQPTDFPYGERQYSAADLAGRVWTFSQSIADVDPRSWGAETGL